MKFYTFAGSQWAQVVHLGVAYKNIPEDQYALEEIDLATAENFNPSYLKVNPNGTVPSMTSPSLDQTLIDSGDILDYLDANYPSYRQLTPALASEKQVVASIVKLVHSERMSTNVIFFRARSAEEMRAKQLSAWKSFVLNRYDKLLEQSSQDPGHPFYSRKLEEESVLYRVFTTEDIEGEMFSQFFKHSTEAYAQLAAGMTELDSLLVLPYAAGRCETTADFHVIPWLAHAMWAAGGTGVDDFGPLEAVIKVSNPDFVVGTRIRQWWSCVSQRSWFKEVYPNVH